MHAIATGILPCLNYNNLPQPFSPELDWIPATTPQGSDEIHKMEIYACSPSSPDTDICANHLPYIQSVQIIDNATGNTIAHQARAWNKSQTQLCLQTYGT